MNRFKEETYSMLARYLLDNPQIQGAFAKYAPGWLRHQVFKHKIWLLNELENNKNSFYSLEGSVNMKCIFIHIPKTAGLSVNQALFGDRGLGHLSIREAKLIFGLKAFAKFFKFTLVRNPYDRCVSAFHYLKKGGISGKINQSLEKHISTSNNFQEFISKKILLDEVKNDIHFLPQHVWLRDENNKLNVDLIARFENIAEDFELISKQLSLQYRLPCINATKRFKDYKKYYDEKSYEIVTFLYNDDIKLFNYEF